MPALDLTKLLEQCPPPEEAADDEMAVADLPFREYRPYCLSQRQFHESKAKYKWARGGLGSGKSRLICEHLSLYIGVALGRLVVPVLFAAQTYRHMMDNALPVLKQAIPGAWLRGGSWDTGFSKSNMTITFAWGSTILLRTAHNKKYQQWRGPEFAALVMDEGRNFQSRKPWEVGIGRLRYPGVPAWLLQAWIGSTTNGFDWQYHEFHGKYATERHEDFRLLTKDNPHLPEGYYEALRASLDEDDARQELDGAFIAKQGACYPKLSLEEWPNGNTLIRPQEKQRPTDLLIDFGYRNPRVILAQDYFLPANDRGDVFQAWVMVDQWKMKNGRAPRNKTLGDMIEWIVKAKESGWKLRKVYCDPAGASANEHAHQSSVKQIEIATGLKCDYPRAPWQKSRLSGETLMRALICSAAGHRRILWLAKRVAGETIPYADECYDAHRDIHFPEEEDGKPQGEESYKDGSTDHSADAVRYGAVCRFARKGAGSPVGFMT